MVGPARRSGFALFSYALLAAVTLWFAVSLVGHIAAPKAPSDPRLRFTSEFEARQYFAQHPNEILAFNRALDDYKSWVAKHPEALNPVSGLGTHNALFATLADIWGLIGASILALLAFGVIRRTFTTSLILACAAERNRKPA